jgi:hypothetical protein
VTTTVVGVSYLKHLQEDPNASAFTKEPGHAEDLVWAVVRGNPALEAALLEAAAMLAEETVADTEERVAQWNIHYFLHGVFLPTN